VRPCVRFPPRPAQKVFDLPRKGLPNLEHAACQRRRGRLYEKARLFFDIELLKLSTRLVVSGIAGGHN
jgi:hypothetical protein